MPKAIKLIPDEYKANKTVETVYAK